jgi:hypothetical protein
MPIVLGNTSISGLAAGGLPSQVVTASTLATSARSYKLAYGTTSSDTGGGGDTGWLTHVSTGNFTVTEAGSAIIATFTGAHGYESGAVNFTGYMALTGATTQNSGEFQLWKQGYNVNKSQGNGAMWWVFTNVAAGTHNITAYVRNWSGGTTGYMNYFTYGNSGVDVLQAWYL